MAEFTGISLPQLRLADNPGENFDTFERQFGYYIVVGELDKKDKKYRKCLLLSCLGREELKIYDSLKYESTEDKDDIELIMKKLREKIIGESNLIYDRFKFNVRAQKDDENFDEYLTEITQMAKACKYKDLEDELTRDRIVVGVKDNNVRKILLQKRDLKLSETIDICRAAETTKQQLANMEKTGEESSVHKVRATGGRPNINATKHTGERSNINAQRDQRALGERAGPQYPRECRYCGKRHMFRKELCPAWGRECSKCGKKNHFSIKCNELRESASRWQRSRNVNQVEYSEYNEYEDDEYETIMMVKGTEEVQERDGREEKTSIKANMLIIGQETVTDVVFQIDSGATINVVPKTALPPEIQLEDCGNELKTWNNSKITPLGKCMLRIQNKKNKKKYKVNFVVVEENLTLLIGKRASEKMGIIQVRYDQICSVKEDNIFKEFKDVFEGGIGTLEGKVHLTLDETAKPEAITKSRVSINLKNKAKEKLDKMEEWKVITKEDEPTEWVSRMAVGIKESGDLRLCLDPQALNKALKREYHPTITLDDVLHELEGAVVLSKFDTDNGYWHCVLDEESSKLTTFLTPFGRYRYVRLPFGLCVSSEIFQKKLQAALEGLENTICIADDIVIYGVGKDKEEATKDHDKKMRMFLERCRNKGIRLNKKKTELRKSEIKFLGHTLTSEGLKADPDKIKAIVEMEAPKNVQEVQRFNGMVNYLARFVPHMSQTIEPLRQLTNKSVQWKWGSEQKEAFEKIKELVTSTQILGYYSQEKPLYLQCDASQSGLGCALLQEGRPLCYASRALTTAETKYAQIEKEMLAIVFGMRRFHTYTFGRQTIVLSDHKPLEIITKKPLENAPRRIQGMMLKLQMYDTDVRYQKGTEMHIADLLSRAHLKEAEEETFEQINAIKYLPIGTERLKKIKRAVSEDETMKKLNKIILEGWPETKQGLSEEIKVYFKYRDELSTEDGLIFRGDRVIIPNSMRQEIKETIHGAHLGIEGCLRKARVCVYWPSMNADIKEFISECETCNAEGRAQTRETLMSHEITGRPWEKVGMDLFELNNQTFLIIIDYFSNFWEVDRLERTTAKEVIRKVKYHFARYGIPSTVISDNGPQFKSGDFENFSKEWDFQHDFSSPGHQQANGMAESGVKMAKQLIRRATDSGRDPFMAILEYRNTPSQDYGTSPAQRMLGRRTRTLLPTTENLLKPMNIEVGKDMQTKKFRNDRSAWYYNKKAKDLEVLQKGDTIRLKPLVAGKKKWVTGTIKNRIDKRSYEVETDTGTLRRNRIHIRRAPINAKGKGVEERTHTERIPSNANSHTRRSPPLNATDHTKTNIPLNAIDMRVEPKKMLPHRENRGRKPERFNNYVDK